MDFFDESGFASVVAVGAADPHADFTGRIAAQNRTIVDLGDSEATSCCRNSGTETGKPAADNTKIGTMIQILNRTLQKALAVLYWSAFDRAERIARPRIVDKYTENSPKNQMLSHLSQVKTSVARRVLLLYFCNEMCMLNNAIIPYRFVAKV